MNSKIGLENPNERIVVYIYRIGDKSHEGLYKIGKTSVKCGVNYTDEALRAAVKKRVDQQTMTARIENVEILYCTYGLTDSGKTFVDKDVHRVLKNSGYKAEKHIQSKRDSEWYKISFDVAKRAIEATRRGESFITKKKLRNERHEPIVLRDEQRDGLNKLKQAFERYSDALMNAKMRYGKTVTTLSLIKESPEIRRVLIMTHRPSVKDEWKKDFDGVFYDMPNCLMADNKLCVDELNAKTESGELDKYIYFASLQDLRESSTIGGKFDKNESVFASEWDLVVVDEAHEGTTTEKGETTINTLRDRGAKILWLSGTPFRIIGNFDNRQIYSWDYIMEQKAKAEWANKHPLETNPYFDLPAISIYAYDLGKLLELIDDDTFFDLSEFFRTDDEGRFVHDEDVDSFLNLLCKDGDSNYPFSSETFRDYFRHTLWRVPGVAEAKALKEKLNAHEVFRHFHVVNIAGNGTPGNPLTADNAKQEVRNAISDYTHTITLTCDRLTAGATVPQWTAVFMLWGSVNTSAAAYMQTMFRVQSPCNEGGEVKQRCYVFDFAPDRTLNVLVDYLGLPTGPGNISPVTQRRFREFLNYCPVISCDGSCMKRLDESAILQEVKSSYAARAVAKGFDDHCIFAMNPDTLNSDLVDHYSAIVGTAGASRSGSGESRRGSGRTVVNRHNLTGGEVDAPEPPRNTRQRSEEEKEAERKRKALAATVRHIAVRIPLLVFGASVEMTKELTLRQLADSTVIDDVSWNTFMKENLSREQFLNLLPIFDKNIINRAISELRRKIQALDGMRVEERLHAVADIISTFRNPDKETVLTPWRVVNIHMCDCLGGYCFFDDTFGDELDAPRWVASDISSTDIFGYNSKILDINAKTGFYGLWAAYNCYRAAKPDKELSADEERLLWDKVLENNIYVLAMSPLGAEIARKTLGGSKSVELNIRYIEDFIDKAKSAPDELATKIKDCKFWNKGKGEMEFKAIVGNPPYQEMGGSGGTNDAPIYQEFCIIASYIKPNYVSLVIPSRWFAAGRENLLGDFRVKMLKSGNISKLTAYNNSRDLFSNVEIKGGVCYFLENLNYSGPCDYTLVNGNLIQSDSIYLDSFDVLIREPKLAKIVSKVSSRQYSGVDTIISSDTPFGVPTKPTNNAKENFSVSDKPSLSHNTALFVIENLKRKTVFVAKSAIKKNIQDIDKYKVFIPEVGGSGNDSKILGDPEYAAPNSICTQSYLYAPFNSEDEAKNFIQYLRTKFLRILVSAIKITQHATSRVYRYVPMQDFTAGSDIDWSKSVEEIDAQLYAKYGLTEEEIAFIEAMIKPM